MCDFLRGGGPTVPVFALRFFDADTSANSSPASAISSSASAIDVNGVPAAAQRTGRDPLNTSGTCTFPLIPCAPPSSSLEFSESSERQVGVLVADRTEEAEVADRTEEADGDLRSRPEGGGVVLDAGVDAVTAGFP